MVTLGSPALQSSSAPTSCSGCDRGEAVDDPRLLDGTGPIRVLIEILVHPGKVWDLASVDLVGLAWEQEGD